MAAQNQNTLRPPTAEDRAAGIQTAVKVLGLAANTAAAGSPTPPTAPESDGVIPKKPSPFSEAAAFTAVGGSYGPAMAGPPPNASVRAVETLPSGPLLNNIPTTNALPSPTATSISAQTNTSVTTPSLGVIGTYFPNSAEDDRVSLSLTASSHDSSYVDPHVLREYAEVPMLPWSVFLRLRRSWQKISLTPQQEESIFKALAKIGASGGSIHDSIPFVSAFIDRYAPELRSVLTPIGFALAGGSASSQPFGVRPGATFLILSVITGHVSLCLECLKLGANPNSTKFLSLETPPPPVPTASQSTGAAGETNPPANNNPADMASQHSHQLRHGYSPMFLACICEQIEIMNLLRQHSGSIHTCDRWGRTPLHAAAAMGSVEVLDWLLKQGAPRLVVDVQSRRPGEISRGIVLPPLALPHPLLRKHDLSSKPTKATSEPTPPLPLKASEQVGPLPNESSNTSTQTKGQGDNVDGMPPLQSRNEPSTTNNNNQLCHCGSKKQFGYCGCVDDMFTRWYLERATSTWSTYAIRLRHFLAESLNPVCNSGPNCPVHSVPSVGQRPTPAAVTTGSTAVAAVGGASTQANAAAGETARNPSEVKGAS